MEHISNLGAKNLLFKGSTTKIGKKLILNHHSFSLTFVSNKDIYIPKWFAKFILNKPHKRNKEIIFIFNDLIDHAFMAKNPFFLYKDTNKENRLIKMLERLESIISLFHKELNSFILHASCLNINSFAYPFIADSMEGKTTLVTLMRDYFNVIHDEAVIVHYSNNHHFISPLIMTYRPDLLEDNYLPIGNLFVLKKSKFNRISHISHKESNETILRNIKTKQDIEDKKIQTFLSDYPIKLLEHYPFKKEELRNLLIQNDILVHNRKM